MIKYARPDSPCRFEGRERTHWDVIVVGGGITGAGILREAARQGLKALLVEQKDFAWGTSSRSSKMVHGGLRYIAQGQVKVTWESVREREKLLADAPGLVTPGSFAMPHYQGGFPGPRVLGALLTVYDALAGIWAHTFQRALPVSYRLIPGLRQQGLQGASLFRDGIVDDARLVLRTLDEAMGDGAIALNYCQVKGLLKTRQSITGVEVQDVIFNERVTLKARCVVNATGAWSDVLRLEAHTSPTDAVVRPLRGSHLVLPAWRLPVAQACCFMHPDDKRPVFVFPWEGCTVVGTTDLDHSASLEEEPVISPAEVEYLLQACNSEFPDAEITTDHIVSTWSGVRPVVNSGKSVKPSKENREHCIWDDQGLITVCGGKLTTFRLIARQVMAKAVAYLPKPKSQSRPRPKQSDSNKSYEPLFRNPAEPVTDVRFLKLPSGQRTRLLGRYGYLLPQVLAHAQDSDFQPVGTTRFFWLELRWAAVYEQVHHLDDLLLRRTRVGNLLPHGGAEYFPQIEQVLKESGWSDEYWLMESARYHTLWQRAYSVP